MNADECDVFENACLERAMVAPCWLPGSNHLFWYKRHLSGGKWQYLFVDCARGLCRPAFDHGALASKLSRDDDTVDPEKLPLIWLDLATDCSWVRFKHRNHTWQFDQNGTLEEWQGDFQDNDFEVDLDFKKPTPKSAKGKADITIVNRTLSPVSYYYINHEGNSDWHIGTVPARESAKPGSPLGFRFRLDNGKGKSVALELKKPSGIANIEETPDGLTVRWEKDPLASSGLETQPQIEATQKPAYQAFIKRHNVWSRKDGIEKQVSYTGFEDEYFQSVTPTPDGLHAIAMQRRPGSGYPMELKDSVPDGQLRPKVKNGTAISTEVHERVGDHLAIDRPRLFDLAGRREVPVDDSLFRSPYWVRGIGWSACGAKYRFLFNERGHKHVRLLEIGLNGAVRVLVEDSSDTVVDYNQKLWHKIIGDEIFWASERDGWNHLYRFSLMDGSLINQVTKGEWVFRSVECIDMNERKIWFKGLGMIKGQDPYYPHLVCVNFDGTDLRIVTGEDGAHLWEFGPDRRFIIDSWSRVDLLPHTAVLDAATGRQVLLLHKEEEELGATDQARYPFIERFVTKGRDNKTDIYGIIVRPVDFDPNKKYPILEIIYAHPFQFIVPKHFGSFSKFRNISKGDYVHVRIDGMGTNWRSKAFRDVSYKNLKDAGFPDRIKWMQAAAKTRPWMDITRVGIEGSSAGGHSAAAALLHHGDFYKAAVAGNANHDHRLGTARWEEMYMGWPVDASYEDNANNTHVAKLRGALMLTTGELDTVVDPAGTMHFADALIKADRDFDLVIEPRAGHHSSSEWLAKKKARFFKRYLVDGEASPNAV